MQQVIDTKRHIIVSMATLYDRKKMLEVNIHSLLEQTANFDKLIINITDGQSDEVYEFYEQLKNLDSRIEINVADGKWRSCNKLLPTISRYPNAIIITVDDDIYYPKQCIELLLEEHYKNSDCIIAHETNPITISNHGDIYFLNKVDVKLGQKTFCKYLTGCCLFPPLVFQGTDVFNYEKMMKYTDGTHDELWFWLQTTLKGIQVIGLNYVTTFDTEVIVPYENGQFKLSDENSDEEKISKHLLAINNDYKTELLERITSKPVNFNVTKDNVYGFLYVLPFIYQVYNYNFKIVFDNNLTNSWKLMISNYLDNLK